jgi:cytoskeleton protein RodZ
MTSNAMEGAERMPARGEAPGSVLGEERLAQNLSVADVARQLKLSIGQVEALEAGDFQRLPGPVFARGFVRNYARLLRLDAEPLLKSLAVSLPRKEPLPPAPPSQDIPFPTAAPRRWRAYAAVVAAIVAALAIYEFFPGGAGPTVSEPPACDACPVRQR